MNSTYLGAADCWAVASTTRDGAYLVAKMPDGSWFCSCQASTLCVHIKHIRSEGATARKLEVVK